jgi:AraC-like DNA-binding protein
MLHNYFKYLNVTPTEKKWGFYNTSVGYSKVAPNENYPKENHPESNHLTWNRGRTLNDFYIVFISKGKGLYGSELTPPTPVAEGTCFVLYPGIWHRYKPDIKSGWEEYWVGFNGFYAKQLMENGFFNRQNPLLSIGLNKDILILFQKLIDAVRASLTGYPQQIAGITLQILGQINTLTNHLQHHNDPVEKLVYKAQFIIHESFENTLDMEELAKELPMGYSAFRKAFKKITGESPNQYHLNLRLNRAKDLLATTFLNINEISEQTGFVSVFYFSKLFKKKNGISPKTYRLLENVMPLDLD